MTRARLPNRRGACVVELDWPAAPGGSIRVHAGPSEVFLDTSRPGSGLDSLLKTASVVLSIARQHGATAEELGRSIPRDKQGQPVDIMGAVIDALIRLEGEAASVSGAAP